MPRAVACQPVDNERDDRGVAATIVAEIKNDRVGVLEEREGAGEQGCGGLNGGQTGQSDHPGPVVSSLHHSNVGADPANLGQVGVRPAGALPLRDQTGLVGEFEMFEDCLGCGLKLGESCWQHRPMITDEVGHSRTQGLDSRSRPVMLLNPAR